MTSGNFGVAAVFFALDDQCSTINGTCGMRDMMKRTPFFLMGCIALLGCLGEGPSDPDFGPAPLVAYVDLFVGDLHVCGLAGDGTGLCWGDNITAQLGTSDTDTRLQPANILTSLKFEQLAPGALHTCGLVSGKLYCWGANNVGQLAFGADGFPIGAPDSAVGGLRFRALSSGAIHMCGITTDSLTYCWGFADRGQLGQGTTGGAAFAPFPVLVGTDSQFVQIDGGGSHTCALTAVGQAWCWGDGTFGQLGNNTFRTSAFPALVEGGLQFQSINAGGTHTCAVTLAGEGYCWGDGISAQLGHGGTGPKPVPTLVTGGITFDYISAGGAHSCGHTPTNEVWCWGINESGQLGTGTTDLSLTPIQVTGSITTFTSIEVGSGTLGGVTCGIATDGKAYCWGRGGEGQIGHGVRVEVVLQPQLVNGSI